MPKSKRSPSVKQQKKKAQKGLILPQVSMTPETISTVLRYGDVWDLSGGAATIASNTFALNGCYDPDTTGVGGQPSGFDYFTGAYSRYCVDRAVIKVLFANTTNNLTFGTVTVGSNVGAGGFVLPASGTDVQQYALEGDHTKYVVLAPTGHGSNRIMGTVTWDVNIKDILGPDVASDLTRSALYGANPTSLVSAYVAIAAWNGTTAGPSAVAFVQISYYTTFSVRRALYED